MFVLIVIVAIIVGIKVKQKKRDAQFLSILSVMKEYQETDNTTLDAVIYAHTLNKNDNISFKKIIKNLKSFLEKASSKNNTNSTTYTNTQTPSYTQEDDNVELLGQLSLFATQEEIEEVTEITNTEEMSQTPAYIPPTPLGIPTKTFVPPTATIDMSKPAQDKEFKATIPKKPIDLDTSSIVLILGVILVLTSAVIFSTTIWDSVGSIAKIGILLGLGFINFLISFAFYKRFENKAPSTAFYVMGYSFVSFCTITFGYFYVSSNLTRMFTDVGWLLTLSVFTAIICGFSLKGYRIYSKDSFLWVSLFCTDVIVFTLSKALFNDVNVVLLLLAIYSVGLVYLLAFEKIDNVKSTIFDFSKVNLLIISFVAVTVTQANIFTILICGILAGGYLLSNQKQFNNDTSAILFCVLLMTGLFKSGFGSGLNIAFLMLTMLPVVVFVFKMMNLLDDELQQKLNFVTLIASFLIFITNTFMLFTTTPSIYSIFTMLILFVAITLLNTLSYYKYIHPILITAIVGEIHRYITYYDMMDSSLASFNISLLLFVIYMFYTLYRKYPINSYVSQNIFPLFLYFICLNTEYTHALTSADHISHSTTQQS